MPFRRGYVAGSLNGLRSPVTDIGAIIGVLPEVLNANTECTMSVHDDDHFNILQADCNVGIVDGDGKDEGYNDDTTSDLESMNLEISPMSRPLKSNGAPAIHVRYYDARITSYSRK